MRRGFLPLVEMTGFFIFETLYAYTKTRNEAFYESTMIRFYFILSAQARKNGGRAKDFCGQIASFFLDSFVYFSHYGEK